jgi:hypothetical protein
MRHSGAGGNPILREHSSQCRRPATEWGSRLRGNDVVALYPTLNGGQSFFICRSRVRIRLLWSHNGPAEGPLRGQAQFAAVAHVEESDTAPDIYLTQTLVNEVTRNHDATNRPGVVVAVVGVDTGRWRLIRVVLSDNEPESSHAATVYQVLHLAPSLFYTLEGPFA